MKTILTNLWNVFAVLLILILKTICAILFIPFKLISITLSIIGDWISIIGYAISGIIVVIGLLLIFTNSMETLTAILLFIGILVVAAIPLLLTKYIDDIAEIICCFLIWIVTGLHLTSWNIHRDKAVIREKKSNIKRTEKKAAETADQLFVGIQSQEQLTKRYKDLMKIYHPDNQAGDKSMSQQIQLDYERLLKTF